MAESPAEEAGIRRGERILAVGAHSPMHVGAHSLKKMRARVRRQGVARILRYHDSSTRKCA